MVDRDNQHRLVDICRQDMRLLAQVGRTADDIVAALMHIHNPMRAIRQRLDLDIVAHRDRIGGTDTADTEIAFDMALLLLPIREMNKITTTGRFDYQATHNSLRVEGSCLVEEGELVR